MARVRRMRLAQGQARQTKSNKENRYVIKVNVMRLNTEGDAVPLVSDNQRMHRAFQLGNNNLLYIYSILS
jgi:hypothetical protein